MAQKINEVGSIMVPTTKNVVFKERRINSIIITKEGFCTINITKISDDGEVNEIVGIPISDYEEYLEPSIWEVIDRRKGLDN